MKVFFFLSFFLFVATNPFDFFSASLSLSLSPLVFMWYRLFLLKDVVNHDLWQLNYRKQTETRASHSAVVPQVEAGARSFVFFWSFVSSGTWGKPIDHRYAARKSRVNKDSQLRNGASSSEHQIFYKSVDSIAGTRRLKKNRCLFF